MQAKTCSKGREPLGEGRRPVRWDLELSGQLFVPAEKHLIECVVLNLCGSGAGVSCETLAPLHSYAELCVSGFGSFECVTSRYFRGKLDLRFICNEARRKRHLADIKNFLDEGMMLRHRRNMPSMSEVRFTRPNGEQFRSGIERMSREGAWLRTPVRPPVGEIVYVGQTYGRVVQHNCAGIAIRFLQTEPDRAQGA